MSLFKALPLLFILFSQSSFAHLLKVFAYTEQGLQQTMNVNGKVYFAGGATLPSLTVLVLDGQGKQVLSSKTDEQGKFSFNVANGNYQIVANSHDGHRATWDIKNHTIKQKQINKENQTVKTDSNISSNITPQQLEAIISSALAQQIQPLSEQIIDLQEKAKFSDILGAIGYIFGIFGVLIWWQQKKKKSS